MTPTEQQIRNQLGQALIARAEADEKIVQLRAMLQAVKLHAKDIAELEREADKLAAELEAEGADQDGPA